MYATFSCDCAEQPVFGIGVFHMLAHKGGGYQVRRVETRASTIPMCETLLLWVFHSGIAFNWAELRKKLDTAEKY